MTVYAYIRISTDKQTTDSQLSELNKFCKKNKHKIDDDNIIIDEGVSGAIKWRERKIFNIINKVVRDDIIIVPEISRLGRNMNEVNEMIAICDTKKVKIIDIKNNIVLDGSFQSSIMANLYTMFAQMERNLISERVKQGLIVAKEKGHLTGRKRGVKKNKLDSHKDQLIILAQEGNSYSNMSKILDVTPSQIRKYMINNDLTNYYSYQGKGQHKNIV